LTPARLFLNHNVNPASHWNAWILLSSFSLSFGITYLNMADLQPPTVVEGATTGDVDDEIPVAAKSAEDRKAQAALSSLDAPREDESKPAKDVDQEAVRKAMDRLAGTGATNGAVTKKEDEKKAVKKNVKVDPADVTLLVCLCDFSAMFQLAVYPTPIASSASRIICLLFILSSLAEMLP
jgi:hypothetical protein